MSTTPRNASKKAPAPPKPVKQVNVLIIDDHPIVRRGLLQTIDPEPDLHVVGQVESAAAAIDAVGDHDVDVAIVDLTLSDAGGTELIKQLKAINKELLILVFSMHDELLYAERALRAGARGYIMKQEGTDRIIDAIRLLLKGEVYLSEQMTHRMLGRMLGTKADEGQSPLAALSDRELEVFELLGGGHSTRDVAELLCVSVKTIESHRENIKRKLNLKSSAEMIRVATQWVD